MSPYTAQVTNPAPYYVDPRMTRTGMHAAPEYTMVARKDISMLMKVILDLCVCVGLCLYCYINVRPPFQIFPKPLAPGVIHVTLKTSNLEPLSILLELELDCVVRIQSRLPLPTRYRLYSTTNNFTSPRRQCASYWIAHRFVYNKIISGKETYVSMFTKYNSLFTAI